MNRNRPRDLFIIIILSLIMTIYFSYIAVLTMSYERNEENNSIKTTDTIKQDYETYELVSVDLTGKDGFRIDKVIEQSNIGARTMFNIAVQKENGIKLMLIDASRTDILLDINGNEIPYIEISTNKWGYKLHLPKDVVIGYTNEGNSTERN